MNQTFLFYLSMCAHLYQEWGSKEQGPIGPLDGPLDLKPKALTTRPKSYIKSKLLEH